MATNDEIDVNPFQQPPGKLEFYTTPKKPSGMGLTSSKVIRWTLYVFNFVFLFLGLGLIIAGAVARIAYHRYFSFLDHGYSSVPIFMIFVGVIITIVSFFGCCGSLRNNYCMLGTFCVLLGVLFIFEISGAIAAYVERKEIGVYMQEKMQAAIRDTTSTTDQFAVDLDTAQRKFHCCGAISFHDWQGMNKTIPDACCIMAGCSTNVTNPGPCLPVAGLGCPINVNGCSEAVRTSLQNNLGSIAGFAIAIAFIQIIGMVLSCILARRIKSGYVYA